MPFKIREYYKLRIKDYGNLADLGPVGDFIGGTTVAFLTAASVVLLLATIIMQRKEIKIGQRSIEELVKQTEASVKQTEEAKEETQITNETMKRQQFETTFFNMINLHHNILNEIKIDDSTGRTAIEKLYKDLIDTYYNEIYIIYSEELKGKASMGDKQILDDLVKQWFLDYSLSEYKAKFEEHFSPKYDENGEPDITELEAFYDSLEKGINTEWNSKKKVLLQFYGENISGIEREYKEILKKLDFNESVSVISNVYIDEFNDRFHNYPLRELKVLAYEGVYKKRENAIGHYYRNLYRIVKLIQGETFNTDIKINELEKSKYRGILRAQ